MPKHACVNFLFYLTLISFIAVAVHAACYYSPGASLAPGFNNIHFNTSHNHASNENCYSDVYTCPSGYNARVYAKFEMYNEDGDYFYIYDNDSGHYSAWENSTNGTYHWMVPYEPTDAVQFRFTSDDSGNLWGVDVAGIYCYNNPCDAWTGPIRDFSSTLHYPGITSVQVYTMAYSDHGGDPSDILSQMWGLPPYYPNWTMIGSFPTQFDQWTCVFGCPPAEKVYYDAYYSNADGTYNATGAYLSLKCSSTNPGNGCGLNAFKLDINPPTLVGGGSGGGSYFSLYAWNVTSSSSIINATKGLGVPESHSLGSPVNQWATSSGAGIARITVGGWCGTTTTTTTTTTLRRINVSFSYIPDDVSHGLSRCEIWTNISGTWTMNQSTTSPIKGVQNNFTIRNIPVGLYIWNVKCTDSENQSTWSSMNWTFRVNSS